jgi:Chitobiase/beta-hexosaminidase C-terminal domain
VGEESLLHRGVSNGARSRALKLFSALSLPVLFLLGWTATAQISVVTQHYDIARVGANTSETILTPANVNFRQFGKLFSHSVDGYVYAQPLYVPGVTMGAGTPQAGTKHNVVFIATENDSVYAFDADSNATAANAVPLWQITLLDAAHGAAAGARVMFSTDIHTTDIVPTIGITGTPVIDLSTGTLYVVGKSKESNVFVQRLHALSITNGAEKFGGPVQLAASVPGNGTGSVSGTLHFDPYWENQRAGLLLLHGIIYIGFGAHEDMGPWHGWILAYNASTLRQTGVWCSTPNGYRGGIWGAGTGLSADVPDPVGHPFGRMFTATGNGKFDAVPNYTNAMDYGDSVVKLDLANGVPTMISSGKTVGDDFTPFNQAALDTSDQDQGSGGTLLLPNSASGGQHLIVQAGKTGRVYILNQENLGGYHPTNKVDSEQKTATRPVYSVPAYWNGHAYFWASTDFLRAFSFVNGVISSTSVSASAEFSNFPGSTPVISANGNTNGIVWNILSENFATRGNAILQAHDAANVSKLLYSSDQDLARDNPGAAVKFTVPTVANGKVYVGAEYQISVYGLLNGATQAAAPVINPASQSFSSSITVTMSDSTAGATIHFTTDGSTPTAASPSYTGPITVTTTETIQAIAVAAGHLTSTISSATYTLITQAAMPTFTPAPGTYSSAQQVTIATKTPNATIYYTADGSTPTTASTKYIGPVAITATETLKAIATAPNLTNSAVASGLYTIQTSSIVAAPTFSPPPGTYTGYQTITISTTTLGATIYYTTNGVTPSPTAGALYRGPIILHVTTTLKAMATAPGMANSTVTSGLYTIH